MTWPHLSTSLAPFLAVLALVLPSGCRSGRVPDDELVVLIESAPQTIDPRFTVSAYDYKLSQLVFAPLVTVDDRLEAKMVLAESVAQVSPTEYLVTLREDARFSDGRPVTSDDVVYTIGQARTAATNHLRLRYVEDGLVAIEPEGPRRVRFRLSHAHAPFVTDLDMGVLARPAAGHEKDPGVGAGAFVFVSNEHERWRFRPNPHYAASLGGPPAMRLLTIKVIRDDNSRLMALAGGSGDLTQNTVSPLLLDSVLAAQPRLHAVSAQSSVFTYLGLNCEDGVLRDPRVRRAIAYAIDRDRIVRTKLGGRAVLATGFLPPLHWAYSGEVERYPHDPARARALLDEAGYKDPDGDGPRPRFTLLYKTSSNRFRVAIAQVIAAQLAEVGIEVDLRPLEFATFFADVKAGNFQLFTMQIPDVAEPELYTNFFDSSRIPTREAPDRGGNRMRYRSADLDQALARGRRDTDRATRIADYAEVQRILARDVPVVPLWHEDNVAVTGANVQGYAVHTTAHLMSLATARKVER